MGNHEAPSVDGVGIIHVADDDADQRSLIERLLAPSGYSVWTFSDGASLIASLDHTLPDVICLDLQMPGLTGLQTMDRIRAHHPNLPIVILTADSTVDSAVAAMKEGAYDYLVKPVQRTRLETVIRNAVERSRMSVRLVQLERDMHHWGERGLLGQSLPMKALFREIDRVALADVTVLITGESGTGKELVARAIHETSTRRSGPIVSLNCAAIPESLQESELFGHERGAFTGATGRRIGRFEQADGGTLFLDEIGELSPGVQAKLLRVLQERRFHRVGATRETESDFRLVAATHRRLSEDAAAGKFREDLYYRIAVFELEVPPLRLRGDDIVLLADTFARRYGLEHTGHPVRLSPDTAEILLQYSWPGNVRELQNAIQRAVLATTAGHLTPADLPSRIRSRSTRPPSPGAPPSPSEPARASASHSFADVEKKFLADSIARAGGNLSEVARAMNISRTTLYRKLRKYGIRT